MFLLLLIYFTCSNVSFAFGFSDPYQGLKPPTYKPPGATLYPLGTRQSNRLINSTSFFEASSIDKLEYKTSKSKFSLPYF